MDREALRAKLIAETPSWYNPYLHLTGPTIVGLSIIAWAVSQLRAPTTLELLTIPIVWLISNMTEWRAHRDLLHHRSKIAPVLYDRHTPEHHMLFQTEDMAVRDVREWRRVLIPAFGVLLLFVMNVPIAGALWLAGLHNISMLYVLTAVSYVLSYEWLHLSYHQPKDSWVGRLAPIRFLARHHGTHHDPRLMQHWNFNVTVPLWDLVRGTYFTSHAESTRSQQA